LLATRAGNHLITLSLQALDKSGQVVESRVVDIPVTILAQPQSLSTVIGVFGGAVAIITGLIGLWQGLGRRTPQGRRASTP
jgi:hypothetical protein